MADPDARTRASAILPEKTTPNDRKSITDTNAPTQASTVQPVKTTPGDRKSTTDPSSPTQASTSGPAKTTPEERKSMADGSVKKRPPPSGIQKSLLSVGFKKVHNFFKKFAPFILGVVIGLCTLVVIINFSNTISIPDTEDVSLGPVYKLFGSGFESPQSLSWDSNRSGILYFMDPNNFRTYKWRPSYGTKKVDFVYAPSYDYIESLGKFFGFERKYRLNFILPIAVPSKELPVLVGFGPDLVFLHWDSHPIGLENWDFFKRTKTNKVLEMFESHQEITVAKASPMRSIFMAGKDKNLNQHSRAVIARYYYDSVIIGQPYPARFFPKLVHVTGMAWSTDAQVIHMLCTVTWSIVSWKYSGVLSQKKEWIRDPVLLVTFTDKPYDMVVDAEDYLWVTLMGLNQVVRVSTVPEDTNRIKSVYFIPGKVTYGIVIGGHNLDTVIVSTGHIVPSGLNVTENLKTKNPGNFYALNVTVKAGPVYYLDSGNYQ